MADLIHLKGMVFFGHHGVHASEQENGQEFLVDLTMVADLSEAAATDRLEATVDYSRVHSLCRRIVEEERFQLIEALAGRLIAQIFADFPPITEITVAVKKPQVSLGGRLEYAAVELNRARP